MSEWVKVGDRLPEVCDDIGCKRYLTYSAGGAYSIGSYDKYGWSTERNFIATEIGLCEVPVTHWRELPEAPNE